MNRLVSPPLTVPAGGASCKVAHVLSSQPVMCQSARIHQTGSGLFSPSHMLDCPPLPAYKRHHPHFAQHTHASVAFMWRHTHCTGHFHWTAVLAVCVHGSMSLVQLHAPCADCSCALVIWSSVQFLPMLAWLISTRAQCCSAIAQSPAVIAAIGACKGAPCAFTFYFLHLCVPVADAYSVSRAAVLSCVLQVAFIMHAPSASSC